VQKQGDGEERSIDCFLDTVAGSPIATLMGANLDDLDLRERTAILKAAGDQIQADAERAQATRKALGVYSRCDRGVLS
jgi:hypothetical protein